MKILNATELEIISGAGVDGVDWGAVGAGVTSVGIGIAIASNPVGWVGAAGATLFAFGGGWSIGRGVSDFALGYKVR